ncbi:hypothetical protein Q5P01_024748 [Channa striata]|uniref:Uncharacterized protein n=1 Tax=Channa striata TaxID=64152 RepID=A0AA88ISU4_CHASR|nr:hypothetical protein Q5P01_024748 [Channa striata]
MGRPHKSQKEVHQLVSLAMLLLNVFLALLATSVAQSGIPQYIQGHWFFDDSLQYEDVDDQYMAAEESAWLDSPPETVEPKMVENQELPTTPEPFFMKEEDLEGGESAVWKIALVVAVLLVSLVGSLSVAYYLCVWRGGRVHHQHQKEGYA